MSIDAEKKRIDKLRWYLNPFTFRKLHETAQQRISCPQYQAPTERSDRWIRQH